LGNFSDFYFTKINRRIVTLFLLHKLESDQNFPFKKKNPSLSKASFLARGLSFLFLHRLTFYPRLVQSNRGIDALHHFFELLRGGVPVRRKDPLLESKTATPTKRTLFSTRSVSTWPCGGSKTNPAVDPVDSFKFELSSKTFRERTFREKKNIFTSKILTSNILD